MSGWRYGLCECCNAPSDCDRWTGCAGCCAVAFCSSVAVGKLAQSAPPRVRLVGAGDCCQACCIHYILRPFMFANLFVYDWPIRKQLAPPSYAWEPAKEFFLLWYCSLCAQCQALNEIAARQDDGAPAWPAPEPTRLGAPRAPRMRRC